MQTINRLAYALASYDADTQSHERYAEKRASLEQACNNISSHAKKILGFEGFAAAHAKYSEEKNLTICCYKGYVFAGFQDRKTKEISLNDKSNAFVQMPKDTPMQLEERMINAINDMAKGRPNIMSEQVTGMWKPLIPLMERVIEYENEYAKLPEKIQNALIHRGTKDSHIDKIIVCTENDLCPARIYNANIEENNETGHLSSICDIPLQERFSDAKMRSQEQKSEKDIPRKERETAR